MALRFSSLPKKCLAIKGVKECEPLGTVKEKLGTGPAFSKGKKAFVPPMFDIAFGYSF